MKARIDNRDVKVKIVDNSYDVDRVEVEILDGPEAWIGARAIVNRDDLIRDLKISYRKAMVKDIEIVEGEAWSAWRGSYKIYGAKIGNQILSGHCYTKTEARQEARAYLKTHDVKVEVVEYERI